ncbi:MAG TPA: glutamine-hydrolyzing GMP synthase, partial [Armatimonadota bacterium]|nr:glutamine-hydrolyzing GMP synthase [Armatimonadota bacterium]
MTVTNPGADRETAFVLDFGAQYAQLIARKVRECGVYCEILPFDTPTERILARRPSAIIFSGGPASVYEVGAPACAADLLASGVPILGICYGHQLIAHLLDGEVASGATKEYGRTPLELLDTGGLFAGIGGTAPLTCWMSHGDLVSRPPSGFTVTARTPNTPVAAMADPSRRLYGVQFHPEVAHTPFGKTLLKNFLVNEAGCTASWTMGGFIQEAIEAIRARVDAHQRVVLGLSGGVDSSVCAALLGRAIGSRLTCILVDHGFMRKGEADRVASVFRQSFDLELIHVDARERFLSRLAGVTDPEEKRKRIGEEFI